MIENRIGNWDNTDLRVINRFAGFVRRCVDDYEMIADGETIAVGVSGGKDSLSLLAALAHLRRFYPKRFEIHAITLDMGFNGMDFTPIMKLCEELRVPYTVKRKDLSRIVFEDNREKNPCALCSKMRRGVLHDTMAELGIKKIALAHHFDDAVETFLLSLLYEGRINCFQPITYMDRTDVTQIRPMLYIEEKTVIKTASACSLPIVQNKCPKDGHSKREEVKKLLQMLTESYPDIKNKIFGAIKRYPIKGW